MCLFFLSLTSFCCGQGLVAIYEHIPFENPLATLSGKILKAEVDDVGSAKLLSRIRSTNDRNVGL